MSAAPAARGPGAGGRLPLALGWALVVIFPFVAVVVALSVGGAASVSAADALRVLVGATPADPDPELVRGLVLELRLPRVVLLLLAGGALSISGAVLQACLQNPLADPGLLGLSGGASLGAVFAYVSGLAALSIAAVPLAAFVGALAAIVLVYTLAYAAGPPTTGTLLLTGVAVASLSSSGVSVLLLRAGSFRVHEIFAWLLGSAEGRTWEHVTMSFVPVLTGAAALMLASRVVDALALGEEHALGAGVPVLAARGLLFALIAVTAGAAVSVVGPVGFVGLMVPHAVRSVVGPSSRRLLPASLLAGGGFLVLCDAASRALSRTTEIPIGVVTALVGVPFFLLLLNRRRLGR